MYIYIYIYIYVYIKEGFERHKSSLRSWFLKEDNQSKSLIKKCSRSSLFFLGKLKSKENKVLTILVLVKFLRRTCTYCI